MRYESESVIASLAIAKRRTEMHRGAPECTASVHARAARGIWPLKTAENWAASAGVKLRIAKYWLAGRRKISDSAKLALIRELE